MKTVNLSGYNVDKLKMLHNDIEAEIKVRQQHELKNAREKILEIARQAGISVEELLAATGTKPDGVQVRKVKPQYRNPSNGLQTWTGRGRQPRWITEGIAHGKTLNDFRI